MKVDRRLVRELAPGVVLAALLVLGGARRWRDAVAIVDGASTLAGAVSANTAPTATGNSAAVVESLIERGIFSYAAQPSEPGPAESQAPTPEPPPPPPPRPQLVVTGIVGGPPWMAVVEGLPGRSEAAVVGSGDRVGTLVVRRVTATSVEIVAPDTVWNLAVRRP